MCTDEWHSTLLNYLINHRDNLFDAENPSIAETAGYLGRQTNQHGSFGTLWPIAIFYTGRRGQCPVRQHSGKSHQFDVIIFIGDLSEAPEFNVLYQVSQQTQLNFIQLPPQLLQQLQKNYDMIPLTMPIGFLKWAWQPITTVGFIGNVVYGRTDIPDEFAYALAKGIDERKDLLETGYEHYAYDPSQVAHAYGVPLARGAQIYYQQKGYIGGGNGNGGNGNAQ